MEELKVTISTEEYTKLLKAKVERDILLSMILNKAHIGYNGKLEFYDIDDEFNAFFPDKCYELLTKLKAEKAKEKDDV